jgi:anti-sigma regulatory factor (Ser/Thr protein kinase)
LPRLSNAHEHGDGGNAGPIELEIECVRNQFAVTVHHDGKKFLTERRPEPPDPRVGDGHGLQIIRDPMDEPDFQNGGPTGSTTLRMAIYLG